MSRSAACIGCSGSNLLKTYFPLQPVGSPEVMLNVSTESVLTTPLKYPWCFLCNCIRANINIPKDSIDNGHEEHMNYVMQKSI